MGTYADTSDLQARLPGLVFDASSQPNLTQIGLWITEGEALLTGALRAGGITVPVTDASGIEVLTSWATDFVEAHTRMALTAASGDRESAYGEALLDRFTKVLDQIRTDPAFFEQMLSGAGTSSTRRFRGYVLDNDDALTIADGDFAPEFTRAKLGDQF